MLAAKTCFLFDLDDTLIDSGALHETAYRDTLAQHKPEILADFVYENFKGQPTVNVFRQLGFRDENTVAFLTQAKQAAYRRIAATELKALPNALDLLRYLRESRRVFLVTSSSAESVKKGLAAVEMTESFDGIVTVEDVAAPKPAPEPYLFCLRKYKLNVTDCVVIEDSAKGVASAQAAGIDVVGVHNSLLASMGDHFYADLFALGKAVGQPKHESERA